MKRELEKLLRKKLSNSPNATPQNFQVNKTKTKLGFKNTTRVMLKVSSTGTTTRLKKTSTLHFFEYISFKKALVDIFFIPTKEKNMKR
jgi:hypothetical protein